MIRSRITQAGKKTSYCDPRRRRTLMVLPSTRDRLASDPAEEKH